MRSTKWIRELRVATLSLIAGILMPTAARAEQFVLFDVTFTFTKADADNSRPSKSHYYIKGTAINPDRPKDWTQPVDYRNGTVHIRAEVIEKPAGGAPTTWTLCYIPNKGKGNGYGCTGTQVYRETGVYEKDVSMKSFWENDSIIWSEGIKQMDLVIKDDSGGSGHAHKRNDPEKFFPTKMRITMIQVSAGSKYDPNVVPNRPGSTFEENKTSTDDAKPEAGKTQAPEKPAKEPGSCCGLDPSRSEVIASGHGNDPSLEISGRLTAPSRRSCATSERSPAIPGRRSADLLRAAGKPAKVALTAAARKLLTILNAMLKANQAWVPPEVG